MVWNPVTVADPVLVSFLLAVVGSAWTQFDLSVVRRVDASARADLLDSIEDGYVLLDDEGRVTDANQRARDGQTGTCRPASGQTPSGSRSSV